MTRGNTKQAMQASGEAARLFDELAQHVEGMLAREMRERVAVARDLARTLSEREREFSISPSAVAAEQPRLAESALTLEDWLKTLAGMERGGDPDTTQQIRHLVEEGTVTVPANRMGRIGDFVAAGRWDEARAEAGEISDRLETLAQKLDTLHRSIVAPKLAALMAAEKRAAELEAMLGTLDTEMKITQWHREANAFIRDLAQFSNSSTAGDALLDAMRDAGWGSWARGGWHWDWRDPYYGTPAAYHSAMRRIMEELQAAVRELLLSDLVPSSDEPTPPQYKELVERYFKTLSADVKAR